MYLEPGKILYEHIGGSVHQFKQLILLCVLVLVQESLDRIGHQASVVLDPKLLIPHPPVSLHVTRVSIKRLVLFVNIGFVCALCGKRFSSS